MSQQVLVDEIACGGTGSKRIIDILLAFVALVLLAPLMVCVAVTILAVDGRSPFVGEARVGRRGSGFSLLKFRSTFREPHVHPSARGATSHNAAYGIEGEEERKPDQVPRIGHFLRHTGVDNLPHLFNILMGDMSFVGPRPITRSEVAAYGEAFDICFSVRPGLTGSWQASAHTDTSLENRVQHDQQYAETRSLRTDLSILCKTVPIVLAGGGNF